MTGIYGNYLAYCPRHDKDYFIEEGCPLCLASDAQIKLQDLKKEFSNVNDNIILEAIKQANMNVAKMEMKDGYNLYNIELNEARFILEEMIRTV